MKAYHNPAQAREGAVGSLRGERKVCDEEVLALTGGIFLSAYCKHLVFQPLGTVCGRRLAVKMDSMRLAILTC